jgi:hypothetical protein
MKSLVGTWKGTGEGHTVSVALVIMLTSWPSWRLSRVSMRAKPLETRAYEYSRKR